MSAKKASRPDEAHRQPIRISSVAYKEAGRSYKTPTHVQSTHQWYCVMHSRVRAVVNGAEHVLKPEESLIVAPGSTRQYQATSRAPGYMIAEFDNLELNLSGSEDRLLPLPVDLRPDLHSLAAEIRVPGRSDSETLIYAFVSRLLIGLSRSVDTPKPAAEAVLTEGSPEEQERLRRVELFLRRNLHRPLGREDCAAVVNLSPSHLAHIYRRTTGVTLNQRLTQLRMEKARDLLLNSSLPITHIALEVGYSSFSHFAGLFKRAIGVTPKDYRRTQGRVW